VQPSGRRPWPPRRGAAYLSLMAFAVTPDLKTIIAATDRGARKYANLKAEPRVRGHYQVKSSGRLRKGWSTLRFPRSRSS
jgi:hypothetical protein